MPQVRSYLLIIIRSNKKERTCRIVDVAVPSDLWVKLKECEKSDKYFDLARELKNWNIKVTIILIVIGALGTVTKGLVQGLEDLEIILRFWVFFAPALADGSFIFSVL